MHACTGPPTPLPPPPLLTTTPYLRLSPSLGRVRGGARACGGWTTSPRMCHVACACCLAPPHRTHRCTTYNRGTTRSHKAQRFVRAHTRDSLPGEPQTDVELWAKSVCDKILNQIHPSRPSNLWTCTHTRHGTGFQAVEQRCAAIFHPDTPGVACRFRHELGGLGSAESSILTIHLQPRLLRPSRLARPPRDHQLRGTTNSEGPPTLRGTATRA